MSWTEYATPPVAGLRRDSLLTYGVSLRNLSKRSCIPRRLPLDMVTTDAPSGASLSLSNAELAVFAGLAVALLFHRLAGVPDTTFGLTLAACTSPPE